MRDCLEANSLRVDWIRSDLIESDLIGVEKASFVWLAELD